MADELKPEELNNQGDYISGDVGPDGKEIVVGKNIDTRRTQQRNTQRNQQRSEPTQNTYVSGSGNQEWVTREILDHGQQIRELVYRLDNIPNDFRDLKNEVDKQRDDIKRLKDLEVIVRPSEVVIRSPALPEPPSVSTRTLLLIGIVVALLVLVAVGFSAWWLMTHTIH
jgi:hypothetical protein